MTKGREKPINKNAPMSPEEAKKLQAESKARVTQLQHDIATLPMFDLNQALNSESSSPEQKELYIQLETTRRAVLEDLKSHAEKIDKVNLKALEKGTTERAIGRTTLHSGFTMKPSEADHAHSLLSKSYLEKMSNLQTLTETLQKIGESLSKENDTLNKRKLEMSSLTRDSDRKAHADRQTLIGSAYNEIGKSFVKILSATDDHYEKDVFKARAISTQLNIINEDLSRLKKVAELNRDVAVVATYEALQSLLTPLFLKAGHTEDLHAAKNIYCSLLSKIQPENKIQDLLNSYMKESYGSTKELLIQEVDKLIAELEMGQMELESLKKDGKIKDKEAGVIWDHFQKNIALMNSVKKSVNECHVLLTQGKHKEHEKAVAELRKLYPEKSPADKLVDKTKKDIEKLTTELEDLKVSANRYVLNWGVRNSVPIVQHLVSLVAPVITPTISAGMKHGLTSANEFINSKLHINVEPTIQTVEKDKETVLSRVATTAKDKLGEVIDKIPTVDVTFTERDLRSGEEESKNIYLNVPGFVKDVVDSQIDSLEKVDVVDTVKDKAKSGLTDQVLGATPTENKTEAHLEGKKTKVSVTPDPGWHTPWTEHLKESASSTALSVAKSAGVFALCTAFPPAAPAIAIASLASSLVAPLYQAGQKEMKDKESMDERISALEALEHYEDKEEMDKTRIGWDKQSTLFKSLSVSGFSKLEVNMRSLPSEMHQTFQPEPRDPMPVEKEKSSTTDILQQLTSGAPQPTPIPAPSISSSDTNIQEQKQAPPSSAIITPDPPQEIFTKRRGLGS